MHFDDRIATVLRQPATGEGIARIQYRQLIDLLGIRPSEANGPQIDAAYLRLSELSSRIPAPERADVLEEAELRLRSPRLIAHLADAEASIASAAIRRAQLVDHQWLDLIPALPVRARGFVRLRRDLGPDVEVLLARLGIQDRGLPPADIAHRQEMAAPPSPRPATAPAAQPTPHPPSEASEGIAAIVRRIEEFRRTRQPHEDGSAVESSGDAAPAPTRLLRAFDFATDAEARIVWAEPGVAPMAVGLNIAAHRPDAPLQSAGSLAVALRHRQPIRAALLDIAGAVAIAGEWQIDALPRFDPQGGRFIGYIGRMRRPAAAPQAPVAVDSGSDRMRQILHELRTPVNAIQGFAEVIQQQLFGPTPHEYRALAATIAGDSARMLAGFEELERLVKLDGGSLDIEAGEADMTAIVEATVAQLEAYTRPRRSGFAVEVDAAPLSIALHRVEAERLVWRMLATLAGAAAPNEVLRVRLRRRDDMVRLTVRLPASLAGREEEELYHAGTSQPQALAVGMFGAGFALRLAATEARAAQGSLDFKGDRIRLSLPGLTDAGATHSDAAVAAVPLAYVDQG